MAIDGLREVDFGCLMERLYVLKFLVEEVPGSVRVAAL